MKKILILLFIIFLLSCNSKEKQEALDVFEHITGIDLLKAGDIKRYGSTYLTSDNPFRFFGAGVADGSLYIVADVDEELLKRIENISIDGYTDLMHGPITEAFLIYTDFGYEKLGYGKGHLIGDKKLVGLAESDRITYRVKLLNESGNNGELIIYDYRENKLWFTKWDS